MPRSLDAGFGQNETRAEPSRCTRRRSCAMFCIRRHWPGASERGSFGKRGYMRTLTRKEWLVAFFVSLLIVGSLWSLAMTYFLYLPTFASITVHREDRPVVAQLHSVATNSF